MCSVVRYGTIVCRGDGREREGERERLAMCTAVLDYINTNAPIDGMP